MKNVGFVYSDRFLDHQTPVGHPERPDRLRRLVEHLKSSGWWDRLHHISPARATEESIEVIHTPECMGFIRQVCAAGGGMLDSGDTYASVQSYEIALLAAGAAIAAVDAVVLHQVDAAFCAVRPPGHHAERDMPMGYCLFNNVAIAAAYAQRTHGIKRVAILDWDVHHGNGTQHTFEADPTVLYLSLHRYPFYPGTGASTERGVGEGAGYTLNFPFPLGTGEDEYLSAFVNSIVPALTAFRPELLIISAGFDAHRDDPLGGMLLNETSFAKMTQLVKNLAPVVSVLEGGYHLDALALSIEAHLAELGASP